MEHHLKLLVCLYKHFWQQRHWPITDGTAYINIKHQLLENNE